MKTRNAVILRRRRALPHKAPGFLRASVSRVKLLFNLFRILWRLAGTPVRALKWMLALRRKYRAILGRPIVSKVSKAGFWHSLGAGLLPRLKHT